MDPFLIWKLKTPDHNIIPSHFHDIKNSTAEVFTHIKYSAHIMPILQQLCWLPGVIYRELK